MDAILLRGQQQSLTTRQSADGSMCRSPVENRKRLENIFIRLQIFLPCGYIQQPGGERRVRALAAADPEQDADGHGEAAEGHHGAHRDGENIR